MHFNLLFFTVLLASACAVALSLSVKSDERSENK